MKDIKCPLCSVSIDKDRYKENYYSKIMNINYKLYICHACSLEFWSPMAMFKEFYEDELHKDYTSFHVGRSRNISQSMNLFFENLPLKSGKLLDVGCGDGIFLEKAREFGFDVWGIDFDSKSIETAKKKRNLRNVFPVSLTEFVDFAKMKNIQFDIITFFEVLEHQDNLQSFIQDITTLLKKDGFIAGSVPNRDRFLAKLSDRAFGFGDYPPHHFTRWSTEILKIYLEKNDFTDIWLKPCYFFSLLEASYWWQRVILGNFMNVARLKIKKFFSGDEQLAYLTMGEIIKNKEGNKKMHIFVGNFFKVINECSKIFEKATFLPLALITLRAMNRQGQSIYFKAKK